MHEMAIVNDLINLCEKNLKQSGGKEIKEVHIKIGRLSGVESHYVKTCYDAFKKDTVCHNAKLVINEQNIVIKCQKCDFEGELEINHFICPKCESNELKIIDGEDMYLMKLIIE